MINTSQDIKASPRNGRSFCRTVSFVITIRWSFIWWPLSVKYYNPSIIRIILTWPSRSHTVNTCRALSQLWVWAAAERPFVFFCSGLSCREPGWGVAAPLWKPFIQVERHTKEDAWLPTEVKTDAKIASSHIREAGKATVTDCGISLFVVSFSTLHLAAREPEREGF